MHLGASCPEGQTRVDGTIGATACRHSTETDGQVPENLHPVQVGGGQPEPIVEGLEEVDGTV